MKLSEKIKKALQPISLYALMNLGVLRCVNQKIMEKEDDIIENLQKLYSMLLQGKKVY